MYEGLRNLEVPRRPRKKPGRLLRAVGLVALVSMLAGAAGLWVVYRKVQENLDKGRIREKIEQLQARLPDEPLNVLILGSDRRDVIEGKARTRRQFKGDVGQRADVMILLHMSPKAESAVLVSLPRDLRVTIPGVGTDKLNAAYAYGVMRDENLGGVRLTIDTVKEFTGLDIHHYVEVNFASFQDIVDAVGGVSIYIDRPLRDKRSGLKIPEPGCIAMNGKMALAYVRARYIDPTADIGRMQRQQIFIRTLLRKVRSLDFLINPSKWLELSEAIGNGVRYDRDVELGLAKDIATHLARNEDQVDFRIVPTYDALIGGISYLVPIESQVDELFDAIRNDRPLPEWGKTSASVPSPADIEVQVLNASAKGGLAAREQERLTKKGFVVRSIGNSSTNEARTIIEYEVGDQLMAKLVARQYKNAQLRLVNETPFDITVRVGADRAYEVALAEWEIAKRRAERRGQQPPPSPTPPPAPPDKPPPSGAPPGVDPEKKRCA